MNNIDILEEKEKEAIKDLEEYLHWEELQGFSMLPRDKHIETLLNLVSTLIAENKELKEKIKEINEEYNAEQKHEMENTIPKSKVEAKIEQLDYNDIGNFERRCKREVLQELLGKE